MEIGTRIKVVDKIDDFDTFFGQEGTVVEFKKAKSSVMQDKVKVQLDNDSDVRTFTLDRVTVLVCVLSNA